MQNATAARSVRKVRALTFPLLRCLSPKCPRQFLPRLNRPEGARRRSGRQYVTGGFSDALCVAPIAELMRPSTIEQAGRVLSVEVQRAQLNSFNHIAQPRGIQRINCRTVSAAAAFGG
jgi:hypothetical protein